MCWRKWKGSLEEKQYGARVSSNRMVEWKIRTEQELLLKQILEKEAGLNPMHPSFADGHLVLERRESKDKCCKAATLKGLCIHGIAYSGDSSNLYILEDSHTRKEEIKNKDKGD